MTMAARSPKASGSCSATSPTRIAQVAEHGIDWFYRGPLAKKVGEWMAANGGIITAADFAAYEAKLREPLRSHLPRLRNHRLPAAQLRRRARRADPQHSRTISTCGEIDKVSPLAVAHIDD